MKYFSILAVVLALIGCQNDAEDSTSPSPQQQQQSPNPMGQLQQPAPDIEVSDEEAETFVDAAMGAREVQMKARETMIGVIESEGLNIETYQKIAQSNQMGQQAQDSTNISDEQMEKFQNVSDSLQQVQGEIQQEVIAAVEEAGMEIQRFQQISQAAQQDPELRQKIQSKMQNRTQQGMPEAPAGN
ncbi:DUF4168 domain-containing protein [Fodinibius sediminis]|uniref:DUF4168 domain-containing protein n=1 Tax=Fodinibius sediminis TaxID=1214077 RepID=UPI00163D8D2D|nr:DUF4168 domain-containing protein [Fodinibius sediminis]